MAKSATIKCNDLWQVKNRHRRICGGLPSHTNPVSGFGDYKWLPTFVQGPNNFPVLITQAYRYNTNLGQVVLGLIPYSQGGYKVASSTGRYIPVVASGSSATPEDPAILALAQPYQTLINTYNNTVIGVTNTPIDALDASVQSMKTVVTNLYDDGLIKKADVRNSLLKQLDTAQMYLNKGNLKAAKNSLNAFINLVKAQNGKSITKDPAKLLIADAQYIIANPK
jgi:2',3'-cyclic-nucleotide 2'-phosphodiesterase (5'-nucleotidase family)